MEVAEVPANQKVEKVFKTHINEDFARKAETLKPTLHEWIDRPLSVIKFEPDESAFFKCRPVHLHTIEELQKLSYGKGDQLILDFGSHRVGYLSLHLGVDGVNVDAPTRLRLTFGEIPYDVTEVLHPCNTWISTSWLPDEVINVDWLPTDVDMPRRYSFRYLKIDVIDTSPKYKVRFLDVQVRAVSAVSPETASVAKVTEIADKELALIDHISQVTLRNCMQTVFEDGPRRDRRLWLGDLRLQALTNYCTFKDYSLVKRCLYMFAALPREDNSLPACVFEKPKLSPASDYIVDYDALFGPTVYDYTLASGDLETAVELWPTILGSLKVPLSHLDKDGKFDSNAYDAWKFLDWSDGLDTNAGMHGLVLFCCKEANKLAVLISKPPPFLDIVDKMEKAASSFYDDAQGVFVSGPDHQVSWISQAWMALAKAKDNKTSLQAITTAMSDKKAVKPLTPYAYHHVAEALARTGGEKECVELLRDYWGGMAKAGADTFWECFDAEDSRRSPYGDCHNNSYCHAWSCTPSYLLRVVLKDYLKEV
ncbi:alpha-L-rhamnosidase [Leptodontidium sp. 2 PMI_412]|nr:bacterial alpha-L-rhamnosidase domain-containing protein [Leptodontidium sp. MPI-SDFR-AT-0119]KAH9218211.1 alpha-L-rhamnosidase [Leptodontidium sp. 2 PMI_412]